MTMLRGEITAGVGELASRMRIYAEHYEATTGMRRAEDPWAP